MRICILLALLLAGMAVRAGENAAPSSHFVFDDNFAGDIIVHEVRVPDDGEALYTYYETLGWRGKAGGYAGIQAHPRGHNYIFSIWDHKSHRVPIKAVHRGEGTLTQKFGGEGTGLKSWNFDLGWKTNTWYCLVARCWPVGDSMHYGFWSRAGDTGIWTHLVTMEVATREAYFEGATDAFIEDWLETGKNARTINLRGGWKRRRDGEWHPFGKGRYSVNAWDLEKGKRSFNFRENWNAGIARDQSGGFYFMTAGGRDTKPSVSNPSVHALAREGERPNYPPLEIVRGEAILRAGKEIVISWELDPTTLPPFATVVEVRKRTRTGSNEGRPVAVMRCAPHVKNVTVPLEGAHSAGDLEVGISAMGILDGPRHDFRLEVQSE